MTESQELFKFYLKKIGSGEHTSHGLTREESAKALKLMISGQPTPAQIGAFMIAHRIRRPEPDELAGMLDTYFELGPKLISKKNQQRPICFGMPFDGRSKTAPIYPLTTLTLLSAGQPVILQGGKRMPTKYGITTLELFNALGLNLSGLTIKQVQIGFEKTGFAFIYQPEHFTQAETLISYRDELGKRPPIASMELLWTAHQGNHLIISGFVHPPTESRAWQTLKLIGEPNMISIKGLEGSTDLSTGRACITGVMKNAEMKRIILHPEEGNYACKDERWIEFADWKEKAIQLLQQKGALRNAVIWNSGVYLWLSENTKTLKEGLNKAEDIVMSNSNKSTLEALINWRNQLDITE